MRMPDKPSNGSEKGNGMSEPNSEPRFDPRHDPIYQRGYHEGDNRTEAPRTDPERPDRHPQAQPTAVSRAEMPEIVRPDSEGRRASDAREPALSPVADASPATESARNPYFLALWIIAVTLIVAGIALEWRTVAMADYGYATAPGAVPLEAIIQQLTWVIAPIMITVGFLTIVALLFWRAVHWRPSDSSPDGSGPRKPGTPTGRSWP